MKGSEGLARVVPGCSRTVVTISCRGGGNDDNPGVTITFAAMEAAAPELARQVRERFDATGLCLVATLRSDGWPRVSPVEPLILDGQLYLGSRSCENRHLSQRRWS